MNNLILLLISTIVFVSYVSYIMIRYGVQDSISESYYKLIEGDKKSANIKGSLFTWFVWGFAFPLLFIGVNPLLIGAASIICFVGAASNYHVVKNSKGKTTNKGITTNKVHIAAAMIGIGLATLSLWFELKMKWAAITIAIISAVLVLFKVKHKTWWIEITAFTILLLALYIDYFIKFI